MRFADGHLLNYLYALVALGCFLNIFIFSLRQKKMKLFIQSHLLDKMSASYSQKKWFNKNTLIIFTFLFSILALARPQYGFEWQEVKREGLDILVVIDASKSMLTQDVKPNRLERTKLAVKDLLKKLKGDRIGLIAFAGDAFLVCPLTVDYSGFVLSLNDLDVNTVSRGGTNISRAIEESMKSYGDSETKFKTVIIVTDGDNLEGDPVSWAKKAKEKGIKIYTIGIGTKEGELIQVRGASGPEFLKDSNGNFVKSRLNERLLQEISLTTGAAYVKASGAQFGLDLIYERDLENMEKREIESKMEKKYYERFQIPLAFALFLLVIESCITTRKRQK